MPHAEHSNEETIEDLEAPAAAQRDVTGGLACKPAASCGRPSARCKENTCTNTGVDCQAASKSIVINEQ